MNAATDFQTGSTDAAGIASALVQFAPGGFGVESNLLAVIAQATARPGKLVRARLAVAGALAHGRLDSEEAVQLACGIEYFHLASLLLDDLPCMDDAEVRRGAPCAHRLHGEASAILGALALINRAYALIGGTLAMQPLPVRLQAHAGVDAWLGVAGLVGGQAADLRFGRGDRSVRGILKVAAEKTGSLFLMAVILPALPGGLDALENRRLRRICLTWGLIFQALDDLGDVLSTAQASGKSTDRDRTLGRPNLALAIGVRETWRRLSRWLAQVERALDRLCPYPAGRFAYLRRFHEETIRPPVERIQGNPGITAA